MARINHQGMVVDIFRSHGEERGTVLFLNGLPAAIGPLPAVVGALQSGWTVQFPQYPGTYDSDGLLSVTAAVSSLQTFYSDVGGGRVPGFEIPSLVIAHSFGAFVLLNLLRKGVLSPQGALLIAPVFSYSKHPDSGTREDLMENLREVEEERPKTYRIGNLDEWQQIAKGEQPVPRSCDWEGKACIIVGDNDDTFDPALIGESLQRSFSDLSGCSQVQTIVVQGAGHGMHELLVDGNLPSFLAKF